MLVKLIGGVTDNELKDFMDHVLEPRLYNARIVADDAENDDECV